MIKHPAQLLRLLVLPAVIASVSLVFGCKNEKPKERAALKIDYPELEPRPNVPAVFKGTIWEVTNRTNDEPYAMATYGLVGRLRGTGDTDAPLQVRQWMIKQMVRHGYGSPLQPGYENINAETILRDPNYAIVRVDAFIPPGARQGDFLDVRVTALPRNKTENLSGGLLFEADLTKVRGNTPELSEGVDVLAKARGPIMVNPAYALIEPKDATAHAKASLRAGTVMDGGRMMQDRPIVFRLRHPARPMSRGIEMRINQRFQRWADHPRKDVFPITNHVAAALDEGLVEVYVPGKYPGDWEHFIGVTEFLYLDGSTGNAIAKAKELTAEAVKPGSPLLEICYALEGIGEPALQFVLPLLSHAQPDVSFAMARAAAFIQYDCGAAQDVLFRIAADDRSDFQVEAIETLADLPASPERNLRLRGLVGTTRNTTARTAAYKALVRNGASGVYTQWIYDPRDRRPAGERFEKFALDIIDCPGEPMVCATRTGIPRIALIGPRPTLTLPLTYTALDNRLMLSSDEKGKTVNIFYREHGRKDPIKMASRPDIAQIVARLGGEGAPQEERFDFTYGEIVAILQQLSEKRKIMAVRPDGRVTVASFNFEKPRPTDDFDIGEPANKDSRPNTDGSAKEPGGRQPKVGG